MLQSTMVYKYWADTFFLRALYLALEYPWPPLLTDQPRVLKLEYAILARPFIHHRPFSVFIGHWLTPIWNGYKSIHSKSNLSQTNSSQFWSVRSNFKSIRPTLVNLSQLKTICPKNVGRFDKILVNLSQLFFHYPQIWDELTKKMVNSSQLVYSLLP